MFRLLGITRSSTDKLGKLENFVSSSNVINFYVSPVIGEVFAMTATVLEVLLALLLWIGYQLRGVAFASGILLLTFALSMTVSFGIKPPLDYSVWTGAAACFLLNSISSYPCSLDHYLARKKIRLSAYSVRFP